MATSIVFGPAGTTTDFICLSDCVLFGIMSSDIGDGENIIKKSLYRLKCADTGEYLTDEDGIPILPSVGEIITIDFKSVMECILETRIPWCGANDIEDATIKKKIVLEVGTSTINYEDCEQSEVVWEQESSEYNVINSYVQPYETKENLDFFVLNTLPCCKTICQGTDDFLYFCGSGSIPVFIENNLGFNIGTVLNVGGDGVTIMNVGVDAISDLIFGNQFTSENILSYTLTINDKTVKYNVDDCCCDDSVDLYFLDPKGGFSNMSFECIESMDITKTGTQICRDSSCFIDQREIEARYGKQFLVKDRWVKVSLKKKVWVDKCNFNFISAFAMSGRFLAKRVCADDTDLGGGVIPENQILEGFILESSSIPILRKESFVEIEINGYYSQGVNAHNF